MPGRDGHRLRVPLPQPGRRPRRPRDRHHAVRRDRRHAGRDAARARARRDRARRSRTSWARRPRATPTASSSRAPASRSASPRPRRSSPRSPRCTCSRCGWPSCAARCRPSAGASSSRDAQAHPARHRRELLERGTDAIDRVAERHYDADFFLYLGRHVGLPVVPRGRAQAQGDLLHRDRRVRGGRDEARPDRAARRGHAGRRASRPTRRCSRRSISNMQEVRARGAHVIAVATEGDADIGEHAEEVLRVPRDRLDAPAAARGDPAAAAGLPDRAPARPERRPAAQPGQDRHRRVESLAQRAAGELGFGGRRAARRSAGVLEQQAEARPQLLGAAARHEVLRAGGDAAPRGDGSPSRSPRARRGARRPAARRRRAGAAATSRACRPSSRADDDHVRAQLDRRAAAPRARPRRRR